MVGKPADGVARDVRVILRVKSEERDRWQRAAKAAGLSFSAWVRGLANAAAPPSAPKKRGPR